MSPDVLVVGGGLAGCSLAREAARAGQRVLVLERGTPACEATYAAAGMLSAVVGSHEPGPLTDILLRCGRMYAAHAAALREETGLDVGYLQSGTLYLSLVEADDDFLVRRYDWQFSAGLGTERLTAAEVLRLEPAINPDVRWALRFLDDHQVDNRLLGRATWLAAAAAGAEFRLGAEVAALERSGDRVVGVRLAGGEIVTAGQVVVAGGCWSGLLGGLPHPVPVEPFRGQIVALESPPQPFRHVVDSPRCYTVPRADGRLLVGATAERVGYRKVVTAAGVLGLLAAAVELSPRLESAAINETWSGLRPGTPDGLPILGPDPEVQGLHYLTGHFRHGILIAPLTSALVHQAMIGSEDPALAQCSVARFAM